MKISLCLTVHDRAPNVSMQVAESLLLDGNQPDELILVLDRPTVLAKQGALAAYTELPFPVRTVVISGAPGWLCPALAWNHAFRAASHELIYSISSEVVQDAGNIEKARAMCAGGDVVAFGACHNSKPVNLVTGADPGLLVSSQMTRPLGFIACMPRKNVIDIGGFDEEFMGGYWYDDDDFFLRMWQTGLDFVFTDDIHGIHLHHERPGLEGPAGQKGINHNRMVMVRKHGKDYVWGDLPMNIQWTAHQTRWAHPED